MDGVAAVWSLNEIYRIRPRILYGDSMGNVVILVAISLTCIRPKAEIVGSPFDRLLSIGENHFPAREPWAGDTQ